MGELSVDFHNNMMVLKTTVLLCVVSVSYGCNTAIIQAIFNALTNPPTTTPPPPTTIKPTTMKPATTMGPTSNSSCSCGQVNRKHKIVNGVETEENEYPWQVGLASGSNYYASCGGSIIGSKSILTAAHCTAKKNPGDIYVLVGAHNQNTVSNSDYKTVCAINDHPDYNDNTLDNDFSILTLCSPLEFSKEVQPVCLPSNEDDGKQFEDQDHVVTGWGTTSSGGSISNVLMETTVKSMSNAACCSSPYQYSCSSLSAEMMCAANPSTDSCQGDSGGPLVTKDTSSGNHIQTGVVSWGYGCALAQYPGVYARVSTVVNWINMKMKKTNGEVCPTGPSGPTGSTTSKPPQPTTIKPPQPTTPNPSGPTVGGN